MAGLAIAAHSDLGNAFMVATHPCHGQFRLLICGRQRPARLQLYENARYCLVRQHRRSWAKEQALALRCCRVGAATWAARLPPQHNLALSEGDRGEHGASTAA